jgi:hypothetical protein
MVTLLVTIELHSISDQLLFRNVFENEEIGLIFVVKVIRLRAIGLVEESVGSTV